MPAAPQRTSGPTGGEKKPGAQDLARREASRARREAGARVAWVGMLGKEGSLALAADR